MADKAWKQFERDSAALFGAKRYPANLGEKVDFEGPCWVGQCKNVKSLSFAELSRLADEIEEEGRQKKKLGVVCAKLRGGTGRRTPTLVIMTEAVWLKFQHPAKIVIRCSRS